MAERLNNYFFPDEVRELFNGIYEECRVIQKHPRIKEAIQELFLEVEVYKMNTEQNQFGQISNSTALVAEDSNLHHI